MSRELPAALLQNQILPQTKAIVAINATTLRGSKFWVNFHEFLVQDLQNEVYQLQQDNKNLDSSRNQLQQQLKRATRQYDSMDLIIICGVVFR